MTRWTSPDVQALLRDYQEGKRSVQDIAATLGTHPQNVWRAASDHGFKKLAKWKQTKWTDPKWLELLKQYAQGELAAAEVGQQLGVTARAVRAARLRRFGAMERKRAVPASRHVNWKSRLRQNVLLAYVNGELSSREAAERAGTSPAAVRNTAEYYYGTRGKRPPLQRYIRELENLIQYALQHVSTGAALRIKRHLTELREEGLR